MSISTRGKPICLWLEGVEDDAVAFEVHKVGGTYYFEVSIPVEGVEGLESERHSVLVTSSLLRFFGQVLAGYHPTDRTIAQVMALD